MRRHLALASLLLGAGLIAPAVPLTVNAAVSGDKVLEARCASCHPRTDGGGLSRIEEQRKTPEGWDMTVVRMMLVHGVKVSGEERAALVKHLSDSRGLTPGEAAPWRSMLERRHNVIENQPDEQVGVMCARCHSYARVGLQRRTEREWLKLVHFHLGQYPTTEYQALARDRNWWEIASGEMPQTLVAHYPLDEDKWQAWRAAPAPDLSGEWLLAGHQPGSGAYSGSMRVDAGGGDRYSVELQLDYANGDSVSGSGSAILYSGYEWRASVELGGRSVHQVLDASSGRLQGRWYYADQDSIGADMRAMRANGSGVLAVIPDHLRAGARASVTVHGAGLSGTPDLGSGVTVLKTVSSSANAITVEVEVAADAAGAHDLGGASFTVYQQVDSVRVEPAEALARVGGNGGPLAPVPAQFDAVAYANGGDGQPGTDDDLRIGAMPAAWSVGNADEVAESLQDAKYAGVMQDGGLFMPAAAGPNPERPFSTNNAGVLTVQATVDDAGRAVQGSGRLVVTVQRWNDPPIR